jgi:hypothetical protein
MSYIAERETQHRLEMCTIHTEPARFLGIDRLEFLAAVKRMPLGHCAERYFIDAVAGFKMDAISTRLIQRNLNLGIALVA